MQRFAHLSDPHLSDLRGTVPGSLINKRALGYLSWHQRRRHQHRAEVLEALLRDMPATGLDQILVTGDLTHIGLPGEFTQARAWLERLAPPHQAAVVPGNHDSCVAADPLQTYAKWQPYLAGDNGGADFPSLRRRGLLAFIGLNSGCPKPPLLATGTLGAMQLQRLPTLLDKCADQGLFRVVYLHHCPLPGIEKWRKRLTDAAALSAILRQHGAELVLHGHGHRARSHTLEARCGAIPVVSVPSASALGLHGADPAAYNYYSVEGKNRGWRLRIEAHQYHREAGHFRPAQRRDIDIRRL